MCRAAYTVFRILYSCTVYDKRDVAIRRAILALQYVYVMCSIGILISPCRAKSNASAIATIICSRYAYSPHCPRIGLVSVDLFRSRGHRTGKTRA